MEKEIRLMKGNEALAIAAIRYGADAYFGYPITPQSEVLETLMAEQPWETTGMVVLQAESEVASINMVESRYQFDVRRFVVYRSIGIASLGYQREPWRTWTWNYPAVAG